MSSEKGINLLRVIYVLRVAGIGKRYGRSVGRDQVRSGHLSVRQKEILQGHDALGGIVEIIGAS